MSERDDYLIWSHEHEAWWRPGKAGYTRNWLEAGRYTFDEARQICDEANRYSAQIQERMMRLADLI